jgi:hypothetical protein
MAVSSILAPLWPLRPVYHEGVVRAVTGELGWNRGGGFKSKTKATLVLSIFFGDAEELRSIDARAQS